MKILAVITARGGSKGVPRKNVREVGGRPLIAWTIEAAQGAASVLHRTVVSTDDPEISQVCRALGAEVPFERPAHLATDEARHIDVLQHAVAWAEEDEGEPVDWVLTLQPTSPLRTADDILASVELARSRTCDSVIGVTRVEEGHPLLLRRIADGGVLAPYEGHALEGVRRQDCAPPVYRNAGAIYLTRRDVLMDRGLLHGDVALAYAMPEATAVDVDSELDLALVDLLLRRRGAS